MKAVSGKDLPKSEEGGEGPSGKYLELELEEALRGPTDLFLKQIS